eukprot:CAMPEP_0118862260 /NCGR_PEP_ID=MMETSP1163-20130328/7523_1 /TAXON_ID=124430 /ORGANISM="Phaeomonas parva, Strain CCMP2877" /LENGTH=66 /DNA_ID=CAMNT_0006796147 /DNA_START=111 /DNA_END=307 /DNA_ORIENTATION=-
MRLRLLLPLVASAAALAPPPPPAQGVGSVGSTNTAPRAAGVDTFPLDDAALQAMADHAVAWCRCNG